MAKSEILVGGVSSNFRINPFTGQKMYLEKASGSKIYTTDGKEYLDFFMGHGAVLLGHGLPEIHEAVKKVFERGFYAEFDSEDNLRLAEQISRHIPCAEAVRFTNFRDRGDADPLQNSPGVHETEPSHTDRWSLPRSH